MNRINEYDGCIVGPVLRKLRNDRKMTVDYVSEVTGLSTSTINQLEQGGRNLSMKSLYILMNAYQVDANTMLALDPKVSEHPIDDFLNKLSQEKKEYFTKSFLYMLEQAI